MRTAIGIICLILLLAFKLIEKKLQKASTKGGSSRALEEEHAPESIQEAFPVWSEEAFEKEKAERMKPSPKKTVRTEVTKPVPKKPLLVEKSEENKPRKHAIDPKKLVIYSEIMKPKY